MRIPQLFRTGSGSDLWLVCLNLIRREIPYLRSFLCQSDRVLNFIGINEIRLYLGSRVDLLGFLKRHIKRPHKRFDFFRPFRKAIINSVAIRVQWSADHRLGHLLQSINLRACVLQLIVKAFFLTRLKRLDSNVDQTRLCRLCLNNCFFRVAALLQISSRRIFPQRKRVKRLCFDNVLWFSQKLHFRLFACGLNRPTFPTLRQIFLRNWSYLLKAIGNFEKFRALVHPLL